MDMNPWKAAWLLACLHSRRLSIHHKFTTTILISEKRECMLLGKKADGLHQVQRLKRRPSMQPATLTAKESPAHNKAAESRRASMHFHRKNPRNIQVIPVILAGLTVSHSVKLSSGFGNTYRVILVFLYVYICIYGCEAHIRTRKPSLLGTAITRLGHLCSCLFLV